MPKKTKTELARAIAKKRIRARIRMEAAIRCDVILNELEAQFDEEFDRAVKAGDPYVLDMEDARVELWLRQAISRRFLPLPKEVSA